MSITFNDVLVETGRIDGLVQGPFVDEQAFKKATLKRLRGLFANVVYFEIENGEKEPGMPDVLCISNTFPAYFIEFKKADKKGNVMFQYTQPLFYKKYYNKFKILIYVWDTLNSCMRVLTTDKVVERKTLKLNIYEGEGNDSKTTS